MTSLPEPGQGAVFATTRWSLIANVGGKGPEARAALEELCEAYWEPVYAFLRRSGHTPDDAADLCQGFFTRLLEKRDVQGATAAQGKFRGFLLGAVKNYLSNERDKALAQKRGGGMTRVSLNYHRAEDHYVHEIQAATQTPEQIYFKHWALGVLETAKQRLAARYDSEGKRVLFDLLSPRLAGEEDALPYGELAPQLAMTENAIKVAVSRMKKRLREEIRATVADTVTTPSEVDDELRFLIGVLNHS